MSWSAKDIPDQTGRMALVTGANSGLGYETALELARKGAEVILACRNLEKGQAAQLEIRRQVPDARLSLMELDLASLEAIAHFARELSNCCQRLDLLVNNAGIMAPAYNRTKDNFELQFGVNHLGHFALTGQIIDLLLKTPGSRVVTVSSVAAFYGVIRFSDLQSEKFYNRWMAYFQSKLSNLLFAYELQRWLEKQGGLTISVAAHPGISKSNLINAQLQQNPPFFQRLLFRSFSLPTQPAWKGALPQLFAATAPGVQGGEYYGPDGIFHIQGYPVKIRSTRRSYNPALAARLWQVSQELTGVYFTGV